MVGIYKITNPKGRIYIGQSVNIERRKKEYQKKSIRQQTILFRSIKKYGFDRHKFEVICECEENQLNELERYYQELYGAIGKKGMNCILTSCTSFSGRLSEETKRKIGAAHKGLKRSEEARRKMSIAKKGRPALPHSFLPKTEETKLKVSKANKGRKAWNKGIKRNQKELSKMSINRKGKMMGEQNYNSKLILNISTGIYYYGIREAAQSYDGNYHAMRDRLNGKTKNKTSYICV